MANDLLTIADFAAHQLDVDESDLQDFKNGAPFTNMLPIDDTSTGGTTHKYMKYTQEPVVGFRAENDGREYDHSVDTAVTVTCKILDFSWRVDKANADAHYKGREYLIALEGARHLAAALYKIEKQIFYGTTAAGDSSGFSGFIQSTFLDALADDMVINSGGSTADVQSSVYAVRVGRDDVKLVTPKAMGISLGDTTVIEADGATGHYPAYYTPASMYIGLQMGGKYSIGRLANCEDAANDDLTDDKLAQLRNLFPAGRKPQYFVANGTRLEALRASRTATNATGAPAPVVTESFGMIAVETDALINTEAVEV